MDATGKLKQVMLTKIPLLDFYGEVAEIFTFGYNILGLYDLSQLRKLYRMLYATREQGHAKFLQHIGLVSIQLSERELDGLIALSKYKTQKHAAAAIGMSVRTLETHLSRIKIKMNCYTVTQVMDYFLSRYNNVV